MTYRRMHTAWTEKWELSCLVVGHLLLPYVPSMEHIFFPLAVCSTCEWLTLD